MLDVRFTGQFKKDLAKVEKQNKQVDKLYEVIDLLRQEKPLPDKNHDHPLIGEWSGCRECHIEPDWLLIYKINKNVLELRLIRTGSHSDLF